MAKLTAKQERFVNEYLVDLNATQAAIRAGYSPKTANVIAAQNLAKLNIRTEIQRLGAKTAARLEVSRENIMQELAAVGFARTTDFVKVKTGAVRITDTDELPTEKAAALASIKRGANGIEVKLHDKVRALELLGKAVGLFDNREVHSETENNLFEAIKSSAQEELETDDIPEIEQEAAAGTNVVEPSTIPKP